MDACLVLGVALAATLAANMALTWLVLRRSNGEAERVMLLAERAFSYMTATTPSQVAEADTMRAQGKMAIEQLEEELNELNARRAARKQDDDFAVTTDGRYIPLENLEAVLDAQTLERP